MDPASNASTGNYRAELDGTTDSASNPNLDDEEED
jgi:hypothetical protein